VGKRAKKFRKGSRVGPPCERIGCWKFELLASMDELAKGCNLLVAFCVLYANNKKRRASHGGEDKSFDLLERSHCGELYPLF
jgi:hypothetical protein